MLGMDVPKNSMKSFYAREDMFAVIVREHLRLLVQQGYRLIVIVNGHGAWGQTSTLERLAVEFSNETPLEGHRWLPDDRPRRRDDRLRPRLRRGDLAHAVSDGRLCRSFPAAARDVKLKYTDWGIADDCVFTGHPPADSASSATRARCCAGKGRAVLPGRAGAPVQAGHGRVPASIKTHEKGNGAAALFKKERLCRSNTEWTRSAAI